MIFCLSMRGISPLRHQDGDSMSCFLNLYKAVNFSLVKQTPFQRKQALIKIRCGQLVDVANTPEHT
jgi:hypothetical protein